MMDEQPIKRSVEEWDRFFMGWAVGVSGLSKDPDRKVGAILVSPDRRQFSMGYNGFPAHMEDLPSLLADREFKRAHMVHAEANATKQAPGSVSGFTLYVTRFPCDECAILVASAGVHRIVTPPPNFEHPRWGGHWEKAARILIARKVDVVEVLL